jgi:hypothetical protein
MEIALDAVNPYTLVHVTRNYPVVISLLIMNQAIAEGLAYQSEHERKGPRKQDGSCICTHMNAKGWFAK